MERLKRIKTSAKLDWIDDTDGVIERVDWLQEGDFRWLIEQAERVEILEKREKELLSEWGKRDTKLIKIQDILNS